MRRFGAIYLVLGTCVAAGLLGLPVTTAQNHLGMTALYVLSAWVLMTVGAMCLLEVTLWFPTGANMITLSKNTLGHRIKWLTWCVYLLLLYSLICAYLAAGSDLLHAFCLRSGLLISRPLATVLLTGLVCGVLYSGMRAVDYVNRFLMSFKIIICVVILAAIVPFSHPAYLQTGDFHFRPAVYLAVICAFGYAIIIPSIRDYLGDDKRQLRQVVLIGSLVPVLLYLVWVSVIQMVLPREGALGLLAMDHSENTNSLLAYALVNVSHHGFIQWFVVAFIALCSATGVLGVGLALLDCLADGLPLAGGAYRRLLLLCCAFLPPMLIVLLKPSVFILALSFAGLFCLYILIGLPIAMYWVGRKHYAGQSTD
jgi:tyrosine-specific transport protein